MTDYVCEVCGTRYTSAAAMMYCCLDTDQYGHPRRVKGDDWLD